MRNLVLALCLSAATLAYARDYAVFDVVGDSISQGINPDLAAFGGWVHILFGDLGDHPTIDDVWPGIATHNHAISGSTAAQWAAGGFAPLQQVLDRTPDLVVVYLGGNDMLQATADGEITQDELDDFRDNLRTIVDRLQSATPRPDIILINYYDLFDGYSENLPFPFLLFRDASEGTLELNRTIQETAHDRECYLVDGVYDAFIHHCYGAEIGDTGHLEPDYVATPLTNFDIHPVTAGHEAIYDSVYETLLTLKAEVDAPTAARNWWLYD